MALPWLDRLMLTFSPKAAMKRAVAREAARMLDYRFYDAGRNSRATYGWVAGSTSANAEIYAAIVLLRNRARDLVRNNPHASKALRVLTNNIVRTGIVAQARTGDEALNKKINDLWKRFVDEADFGSQIDLYGLQRVSVRSMLEGGEMLCRLRVNPNTKGVPLRLQCLEGDFLDHRKNEGLETGPIHQGVQFDKDGQRVGYWLFREHPGDAPFAIPQSYKSDLIPASTVLHLYDIQRLGQIRGVSWFAPGMIKARELDTYEEAELVRKRIEACVAAMVIGADDESENGITTPADISGAAPPAAGTGPRVTDASGNTLEQFEPGLIAYARGAKDIKFTQPSVVREYADYKRAQLRTLSAAWDLTYELMSGDLSQVNFSSIRVGLNEFKHTVQALQQLTIIPMWLQPVWNRFFDFGQAAGLIPANCPRGVDWTAPKFESVNPVQDAQADVVQVRALLKSPQEAIRERGYDPDEVLADATQWHKKLEAAGVVSDADAAQTAKPGAGVIKGGEGGEPTEVVNVPAKDDDEKVVAP